ncbi:MAG: ABC transporter permease [Acidobacteria bacterium]|nr:ABC transporter permease [Acidobacteriota bacterium]
MDDLKHSLRLFAKNPGFLLAAVAALAIGIGANTAIFSVVNAILFRPAPFPDAERIVTFGVATQQGGFDAASPAKFQHWREQTASFQDVAAYRTGVRNWTGGETPEQLRAAQVSAEFFRLFGAPIILGQTFSAEQDRPNGPKAVLIAERLWTQRFARNPNVLGRKMLLGGEPHDIIGVVGQTFDFRDLAEDSDVWTAFQLDPNTNNQGHYFAAAGRLKDGVTLQQAQAQIAASTAVYAAKFPNGLGPDQSQKFRARSLQVALSGNAQDSLLFLEVAVGMVLLIACSNVANLLLARAVGRRREIAIRSAIGAGRGRIVRQLLTESVLLGLAGGVAGFAVGLAGIRALLRVNTAGLPRMGQNGELVAVDWRVLAFTIGVALLTSVIFGLVPALQASKGDLAGSLKEAAGRTGSGLRQNKSRTVLVVVEIALAAILVIGAALLIQTSINIYKVNPGYDTANVLTMKMSINEPRFHDPAAVERLVRTGVERLRALPGVEYASASCCLPLDGGYGLPFRILGRPTERGPFHGGGTWTPVSPGYFEAFRIAMTRGRTFNERDDAAGVPVAIINQAMAKQFWPKGDPMSDRILIGKGVMPQLETEQPRQIIGIAADVRDGGLNDDPNPHMYIPTAQQPAALNALNVAITPMAWIVRTRSNPGSLAGVVREELKQITALPVSDVRTMTEVVERSTARPRFNMLLMTIFGAAALLLAAIGVYGLMAYSVEQRQQEIGIRLALGAQTGDVRGMVVWQGMRLAAAGLVVGVAGAYFLTGRIQSLLFGVAPRDPAIFVGVPVVLAAVALAAVWLPALRATRVDPVIALRAE